MKQVIKTDAAPAAIGPYSQAIKIHSSSFVFCSMQIALDPKTGQLVGATTAEQCKQVMENISGLLKAAGSDFSRIIKTTIYLTDMGDFAPVNEVYGSYFQMDPPARGAMQVCKLPKEAKVAIEVVALS
jgi:2-iminobutanoate/2-iminopropanoate deaminase